MTKVLTIDGNWLARSRFEAFRGEEDEVFQCVAGFLARTQGLREYFKPETVAVAWDGPDSIRKRKVPGYKAQRPPAPDGFLDALRQIKNRLKGKGAYQFFSDGWEGDDVIATIVRTMPGPHTIFSVDKDLFQLVRDDVQYYRALGDGVLYRPEDMEAETGLTAEGWTSYLALVGDTADNLKGVPGIGDVKARQLLSAYPRIVPELLNEETRLDAVDTVRMVQAGNKKLVSIVEKCAEHHRELTETWLAVLLQTVELQVIAPEVF